LRPYQLGESLRLLRHLPTAGRPGEFNGSRDVDIHEAWRHPPFPKDEAMKATLSSLQSDPPSRVFSSSLRRAQQTASHVLTESKLKREVTLEPLFAEMNFGAWEGLTWSEIAERFPIESALWLETWLKSAPPGGETLAQVEIRIKKALSHWTPKNNDLIVCHGGIIKIFLALESGNLELLKTQIDHHSIYPVDIDKIKTDLLLF